MILIKGGKMVKEDMKKCCAGKFPTFAVIVLVIALLWIASEVGWIAIDIPWFPVIIAIIALGMIVNKHHS